MKIKQASKFNQLYSAKSMTTADYFYLATRIWSVLLVSMPLDFVIAFMGLSYHGALSADLAILFLLLGAWILSWRDGIFWTISLLRKLKLAANHSIRENKVKSMLAFFIIFLLSSFEIMFRLFQISSAIAIAALVAAITAAVVAAYRGVAEFRDFIDRSRAISPLNEDAINKENFVLCLAPLVLLRIAALLAVIALMSEGIGASRAALYLAVLLSFQNSEPMRDDFFRVCCSCGKLFAKTTSDTIRCRYCVR